MFRGTDSRVACTQICVPRNVFSVDAVIVIENNLKVSAFQDVTCDPASIPVGLGESPSLFTVTEEGLFHRA